MKFQSSPKYFSILTIGSFLMAVISFTGIFSNNDDIIGRLITGFAWSLVTFGWLGQYYNNRKTVGKRI